MTDRLAILITAATPDRPQLVAVPLVHALAALALDAKVEIHFAGPAVRWLVKGMADTACPSSRTEKPVSGFLADVIAEGAAIFACSMALAEQIADGEQLIPAARQAGATAFIARALDPAWKALVY